MEKGASKRRWLRLAKRKQMLVPTLLGWVILCVCLLGPVLWGLFNACSFLSCHRPIRAQALIIEGWVPDYVLEQGLREFREGRYSILLTTGGPLWRGEHLARYKTNAELSAASLVALGVDPNRVLALPAPDAPRDRTRISALEVAKWQTGHLDITSFNLMTLGPHARRSFLEFKKVLPGNVRLGVLCVPNEEFDREKWWTSSEGLKTVFTEGLAYLLKRFS